jgi:hypothetical protein
MSEVRRRCVFYVSGFDPKGASHYHALYKEQAALQAKVNGLEIDVGPRRKQASGNSAWELHAIDDGVEVDTWYEFLRWDDIVRAHWSRHQWQLWRDTVATSWFNLRCGALWKMFKLCWPPSVALTLPLVLVLAVLIGVPVPSAFAGALVYWNTGSSLLALLISAATAIALVLAARKLEARYSMYWIMRSYAFTRLQALGQVPALEERLDAMAARVAQRVTEARDDEVLVVGHSSGAIMAVAVMARALAQLEASGTKARERPALSLLTLGQCIPMLGLVPQAERFRQELAYLAMSTRLDQWIDFSAPPDGSCFALTDPIAGCEVKVHNRPPDRPKLLSPRFAQMFNAESYRDLKRDKFRMHFQYLMASQLAAEYDFFGITAGARRLADRWAATPSILGYADLQLVMPGRPRAPRPGT